MNGPALVIAFFAGAGFAALAFDITFSIAMFGTAAVFYWALREELYRWAEERRSRRIADKQRAQ